MVTINRIITYTRYKIGLILYLLPSFITLIVDLTSTYIYLMTWMPLSFKHHIQNAFNYLMYLFKARHIFQYMKTTL